MSITIIPMPSHDDDYLTAYVSMRLRSLEDTGAELAKLAETHGLPKSGVNQVKNGVLGVGMRTVDRYAALLGKTRRELQDAAEAWWNEGGRVQSRNRPVGKVDASVESAIQLLVRRGDATEEELRALVRKPDLYFQGRDDLWWAGALREMLERSRRQRDETPIPPSTELARPAPQPVGRHKKVIGST